MKDALNYLAEFYVIYNCYWITAGSFIYIPEGYQLLKFKLYDKLFCLRQVDSMTGSILENSFLCLKAGKAIDCSNGNKDVEDCSMPLGNPIEDDYNKSNSFEPTLFLKLSNP